MIAWFNVDEFDVDFVVIGAMIKVIFFRSNLSEIVSYRLLLVSFRDYEAKFKFLLKYVRNHLKKKFNFEYFVSFMF